MSRIALAVAMWMALLPTSVLLSAERAPLADFTPDGTWDCQDQQGTNTGTVVVADISYAYIKADGRLGGYGKLFRITDDFDLPHFAMVSGYMHDQLHALGIGLRGPRDNNHDLSGEIFVNVILSADGHGADDWDCRRRERPH